MLKGLQARRGIEARSAAAPSHVRPTGQAICQSKRTDCMSCGKAGIKRAEEPAYRLPADMRWRGSPTVRSRPATHSRYRNFSVASPIIARISAMIQKRMTICGSAQPFFS